MSAAKEFTAAKLDWLDGVASDLSVPNLSFRLAYLLGGYFNHTSGDAWPAQKTLAAKLGVTRRCIQMALNDLMLREHLAITKGNGRGNTSRYRPLKKGAELFPLSEGKGRTAEQERAKIGARKGEKSFAQNTFKNPSRNTSKKQPIDLFRIWFGCYPRKEGEEEARFEYERIIASGEASPDDLARAVISYDKDCSGTPPRLIAMPADWLKQQRWRTPAYSAEQEDAA